MGRGSSPGNDLTCHACAWVREVPRKTEVGDLEDASATDEEIVRFEIAVQDMVPVAEFEPAERHGGP
jgi:hypothetical protein